MRRILVCLDRSPRSEKVLQHAIGLARAYGSEVTLVHVLESHLRAHEGPPSDTLEWEIARVEAAEHLNRLAADVQARGIRVETVILQGHPAEQVLCLSDRGGFDLIVLSTHGEKGVTEWGLSSTADKVVARSCASVLIVPTAWSQSHDRAECPLQRILILLDGSPRAEAVLPPLRRLASSAGSTLVLLHAVPEPEILHFDPPRPEDVELLARLHRRNERAARQYLSRVRDHLGDGCHLEDLVEHGDLRLLLRGICERERIDLIAFTAHGKTGHRPWCYGGIAGHLVHHAERPILMIQNLPQRRSEFEEAVRHVREAEPLRGGARFGTP
ncbi:MAG: universal stress protein [bacterium]|nr:universal stress protein [bacterium]